MTEPPRYTIAPANWDSFQAVMGEKGGCGGCWCMLWRLEKRQMDAQMGEPNRRAMKAIFDAGHIPGLICRHGETPVGWIQVDERTTFPRLEHSRVLKPVDDKPVWSVSCFFIDRKYRRQGLSAQLLEAACTFVKERGGAIVEGYPIDTPKTSYPAVYAWTGMVGAFRKAGFHEVARRSATRPIMRKILA